MIHRYVVEFNIEQNHIENNPLKFFDFLSNRFSPDAKLELIRTGREKMEDYSQKMCVMVVGTPQPPKKAKTIDQQLAYLKKGK